ncbi:MAG: hypothetical protein M0011_09415 [Elusimicrobia bacterium]|nr:hypothetical protein [Elusimicrobiota bacterium]
MRQIFAAAMAVCLLPAQAAAAKTAGNLAVLGDAADYSSASSSQAGAAFSMAGGLSSVANDITSDGANLKLESGFYSRLVVGQSAFGYYPQGTSSVTLSWTAANPNGTTYDLFVSTWQEADPYMAYYSTDAAGYPVESLAPNTSYYVFSVANYMEGDYSAPAATTTVTLAGVPSTGAFTLADAGHDTLALSFTGPGNSPPLPLRPWFQYSAGLPRPLYGQSSVVYATHVYLSGGFDGVYFSSAVYRAELLADGSLGAWETAAYMPEGLYGHQAVAARGRLFVLGGYSSSGARREVWSTDISSAGSLGAWEPETPLPDPMYFHAAALVGDKIYVSGGYKSGSGVLAGFSFAELGADASLGAWDTSNTMPAPRYAHSMTLFPGMLVIAGGKDGASARAETWSCPVSTGGFLSPPCAPWTPLPGARYGHSAVAEGTRFYIVGGNNGYAAMQQVYQTTIPAAGLPQWGAAAALPAPVQFSSPLLGSGGLYLFGGSSGSSALSSVYASSITGTEYALQASPDPTFSGVPLTSKWSPNPGASFSGLAPLTQYYFRAKARNWTGVETDYSPVGSTFTYAAIPATASYTGVGINTAVANWAANGNPAGTNYQLNVSTSPDFYPEYGSYTTNTFLTLSGLLQSTTYYSRVRVFSATPLSRFAVLPPVKTSYDPALDVDSPTIVNGQSPGDYAYWIATNTFLSSATFTDVGASGISYFELQVSTKLGDPASATTGWLPAVSGINQPSYSAPWTLPQSAWDAMLDGASSYVSVRVYDNSGNYSALRDIFSVLKDSTPPVIGVPYAAVAPTGWLTDNPGKVTDLRFDDPLSGLAKVQYSVSRDKLFADGSVIPWTDMDLTNSTAALAHGATWYQTDLSYSFNALANAASNYFSFRAVDVAGSTYTFKDAFGIAKNVSGPTVAISTPAGAYLSTFTVVSGNTAETNAHPVLGTEISLRDLDTGLYFNGVTFLSGSQYWLDAADQGSTFTLTLQNPPLISGRHYQAVARSSDSAGDYSQLFATHTFTFDTTPPSAGVIYPAAGSTVGTVGRISGTASDASSPLYSSEVVLRRLSDGRWWKNDTSSWDLSPQALQAGTTPYWTWNFQPYLRDSLTSGASYYASVRATDGAYPRNVGAFFAAGSTFTYLDDTAPPPTLTLGAAPGAYSGSVALTWRTSGDNAYNGYLLSGTYKIAYSTYTGAAVSTQTAQVTIATATLTAGATQQRMINGLDPAVTYYFTLWTADDAQNWSAASPQAQAVSGAPGSGSLGGRVLDASTQPVTGVLVEAIGPTGAVEGSDYTDTFGRYSIPALDPLYLTVRAVWTAEDIESSVTKDSVPNGSSSVDFRLSVTYQLAAITGVIPSNYLASSAAPRPSSARYTTREAGSSRGDAPFVELYSHGRRIGAAFTDTAGAFRVDNLLPGTYGLRVFNGEYFSEMATVRLYPGQQLVFTPKFELLDKSGVYAYPNPARTAVNFRFAPSAVSFRAQVQVFDIAGTLIRTLDNVSPDTVAGGRKISWDLAADRVAPGVYLYILRVQDASTGAAAKVVKKFAVIR